MKEKVKDILYEKVNFSLPDERLLKNNAFKIMILDNVSEELWHRSGVISADMGCYYTLLKMFNKNSIKDLIIHLEKKSKTLRFKYPTQEYYQHYDSCGVSCLLNAAKFYYPDLEL